MIPTVVARLATDTETAAHNVQTDSDEMLVLRLIHEAKTKTSLRDIAEKYMWTTKTGGADHNQPYLLLS
jgi:hypothetical protein